jgi:PiT family inorganic phosphate transporter
MTDIAIQGSIEPAARSSRPSLDAQFNPLTLIIFFGVLAFALLFVGYSLYVDVDETGVKSTTLLPEPPAVRSALYCACL